MNNKKIISVLIIFTIIVLSKFHYNFYGLLKSSYEERLIFSYGLCNKHGYGFVQKVKNNFIINKNIKVINEGNYPSIGSFFYDSNKKYDYQRVILINPKKDIKKEKILYKYKNCFFVKL